MCGRFFVDEDFEAIYKRYDIHYEPELEITASTFFPSQKAPVVIDSSIGHRIGLMQWGFSIPGIQRPVINSRSETVFQKASFSSAIMKRRCLIPASGYVEWETSANGKKIPFAIRSSNDRLMSFAGLYTSTLTPEGDKLWQFSILTRSAQGVVSAIHDRMPVILTTSAESAWLSRDLTQEDLKKMMSEPYRGLFLEPYDPSVSNV